jgi:hypothetical protein
MTDAHVKIVTPELHYLFTRWEEMTRNLGYTLNSDAFNLNLGRLLPKVETALRELVELHEAINREFMKENASRPETMRLLEGLNNIQNEIRRLGPSIQMSVTQGINSELVTDKLSAALYKALVKSTGMKDDGTLGDP